MNSQHARKIHVDSSFQALELLPGSDQGIYLCQCQKPKFWIPGAIPTQNQQTGLREAKQTEVGSPNGGRTYYDDASKQMKTVI